MKVFLKKIRFELLIFGGKERFFGLSEKLESFF